MAWDTAVAAEHRIDASPECFEGSAVRQRSETSVVWSAREAAGPCFDSVTENADGARHLLKARGRACFKLIMHLVAGHEVVL